MEGSEAFCLTVPAVSDNNSFVGPMLTDLYQVTMAYAYWDAGRHEIPAVFELYFRKNPFNGNYAVFAGLGDCISFLHQYRFLPEHIRYLRSVMPDAKEEFFTQYLANLHLESVQVFAVPEGSIVFPSVPLMRVCGPLAACQLLESTLLNLVNYATLVATNAARHRVAAGQDSVLIEFGLRRAQGPDGAMRASKYAYVGGFDATSNVLAGRLYGIPVRGTHAHSFVESFSSISDIDDQRLLLSGNCREAVQASDFVARVRNIQRYVLTPESPGSCVEGELAAFISYALSYPSSFTALVDTYDTLRSGVPNFIAVALALAEYGYKPVGIRLDSGDLASLSCKARAMMDRCAAEYQIRQKGADVQDAIRQVKIMASNDLNEAVLRKLRTAEHAIDAFGIGTELVTCSTQPALGGVYKLMELDGSFCMKISEEPGKISFPGCKNAYRVYQDVGSVDSKDVPVMDFIAHVSESPPTVGKEIQYIDLQELRNSRLPRASMLPTAGAKQIIPSGVERLLSNVWSGERSPDIAKRNLQNVRCLADLRTNVLNQISLFSSDSQEPGDNYTVGISLKLMSEFQRISEELRTASSL